MRNKRVIIYTYIKKEADEYNNIARYCYCRYLILLFVKTGVLKTALNLFAHKLYAYIYIYYYDLHNNVSDNFFVRVNIYFCALLHH